MSSEHTPVRPAGLAALVGSKPAEGYQALDRLGIPYIWFVDPADGVLPPARHAVHVVRVPFQGDPMSVLRHPMPPDVCGVLSFTEMGSLPAALVSEALGLPTVPTRAVLRARDKLVMRRALGSGPDRLAFGIVGPDDPREEDFPVIAKPADGSSSQGIEYLPDPAGYRVRAPDLAGFLWEHFIGGPEYSVEAVSFNGVHRILGITAKQTTGRPHFVESGHEVPAALTSELDQEIRGCVSRCLDTLEITTGASHTEVKVEDGHAVVIETHTRAGGDRIPLLIRLVTGVDQYELAVQSVLPWATPAVASPRFKCAAVHYFRWQEATIDKVEGLELCREMDGVVEIGIRAANGTSIPVWRHSHQRPGHVVVGADDRDELERRIAAVSSAIRPRLRPGPGGSASGS